MYMALYKCYNYYYYYYYNSFTSSSVSNANSEKEGSVVISKAVVESDSWTALEGALSAGRRLDLTNKIVPHIIGELDSIRVRRESFISLNIQ